MITPYNLLMGIPFLFSRSLKVWEICPFGNQQSSSLADGEYAVGISINKLNKKYSNGKLAVNNLDLTFYQDQVTALLGRNGAGKTSTM